MAESVAFNIENSLRELEQLERVGLFTSRETQKVIKKRKSFEYRLAKQRKLKEDYLKYIQYEIALLSLVRKRREQLGYKFKRDEIENVIGNRINCLFKAAIKRHSSDTKLWLSHREFLKKMNWYSSMSGMMARMLQLHSKTPELWVVVAKWEMEENNSPQSARQLCQRAIRFHPTSQLLWREYFRMELMYAFQLRKRREILKVPETAQDAENGNDEVLAGKIALVIYSKATSSMPDVEFSLSFLPICADFDFTKEHEEHIYLDVQEKFPEKEETWNAIAKRRLAQLRNAEYLAAEEHMTKKKMMQRIVEDSFAIYDEAIEKIPTVKMWSFYIQAVVDSMEKAKTESKVKKLLTKVLSLMSRASEVNLLSSDLCIEWVCLLNTCGQAEDAKEAALKSVKLWPSNAALWNSCLVLVARQQDDQFLDIFNKAIHHIPDTESLPLWQLAVEWATLNDAKKLEDILERGIKQSPTVSTPLKVTYLELTAMLRSPDAAWDLYNRIKNLYPLSPEVYEKMIFIEKSQLEPSIERMRKCYEDAVLNIGTTSVEIWLNYIRLELQHPQGNPKAVGKLYIKAVKMLPPVQSDEFLTQYTLLSTGHDVTVKHKR